MAEFGQKPCHGTGPAGSSKKVLSAAYNYRVLSVQTHESVCGPEAKFAVATTRFCPGGSLAPAHRKMRSPPGSALEPRETPLTSIVTSGELEYTLISVTGSARSMNLPLAMCTTGAVLQFAL